MKLKKVLALLLSFVMLMSLAACNKDNSSDTAKVTSEGGETKEGSQETTTVTDKEEEAAVLYGGLTPMANADDPITFKIFIRDPSTAPAKDNPVMKKITELTGVTIEYEFLVGDLAQKQGVMIAGEDYPDAIFAESAKFIDAGAFIPIEDKLADYPNLYAHYSPHKDKMTALDGHQYILELYSVVKNPAPIFNNTASGFYIQKAVLEDAGYAIPRTLDEYFTLIENYQKKNPEIDGVKTIGFEVLSDGWRDFCLRNPAQHLMGAGNDGDVFVDLNTMEASLYQISDTAKGYYKKLNEEYQKGIIQAETFIQSYDEYISRLSTGAVLGFFDQQWNFNAAESVLKTDGKYNRTYISVPIANPGVTDGYLDAPNGQITGNNGLGITKNCKDPERLLAFFDWLLQPEVQDYLQWGEEGTDFEILDNGGKVLTEERRTLNNDDARKRQETGFVLWNYSPKRQGLYDNGSPCGPGDSADEYLLGLSEYDQKFLKAYEYKYPSEMLSEPVVRPKYYPVWAMPIEDGSPAKVASNKFVDVCRKYYPQLVLCDPADYDTLWNDFVKEFEASNPQAFLDEVNRQIKEVMK
jgi:putative aldouronate transport system substrate-binding protein